MTASIEQVVRANAERVRESEIALEQATADAERNGTVAPVLARHLAIHSVYVVVVESATSVETANGTSEGTHTWALHSLLDLAIPEDVLVVCVVPSEGPLPAPCDQLERDHRLEFGDGERRRLFFVRDGSEEVAVGEGGGRVHFILTLLTS